FENLAQSIFSVQDTIESMDAAFYFRCGVWPQLLCHPEQYLRLKWLAENMNHAPLAAVSRLILDDAVLENGIRKGIFENLTQKCVVILGPHFKRYLHTLRLLSLSGQSRGLKRPSQLRVEAEE